MSTWTERAKSHAVWERLETLGPAVDQGLNRDDVTPAASAGLNRIKTVVSFTGKRLSAANSVLIQPGPLDSLATALQAATTEVQAYVANGNEGHIANANTNIDNALGQLAQVIVPVSSREMAGLREAADAYRTTLEWNALKAHDVIHERWAGQIQESAHVAGQQPA